MKLESVRVFVVGNPPPGYGGRYFIFVKLTTDAASGASAKSMRDFGPHVVARDDRGVFARYVEGMTRSASSACGGGSMARAIRFVPTSR